MRMSKFVNIVDVAIALLVIAMMKMRMMMRIAVYLASLLFPV